MHRQSKVSRSRHKTRYGVSSSAVAGRGAIGKEAIELTTATTDRPRPIARVIGRSRPTSAVILESSSESRRVRRLVATMAIATAIRGDAISRGEDPMLAIMSRI